MEMKLFKYIFILLPVLFSCSGDGITPELEEALYHFYTGQSYQREHKYYDAMEEFLLAEELSASSDKVVLKGQICSTQKWVDIVQSAPSSGRVSQVSHI